MKNSSILLFLLIFSCFSSSSQAYIDPEELLKTLPPPQVNYPIPVINASLPAVLLPADVRPFEDEEKEISPEFDFNSLQAILTNPAIVSTKKLIAELAKPKAIASPTKNLAQSLPPKPRSEKTIAPIASASRAVRPPALNISPNTEGKHVASTTVADPQKALANNNSQAIAQPRIDGIARVSSTTAPIATTTATAEEEPALITDMASDTEAIVEDPEAEATAATTSYDAILTKATGLFKKQNWQEIKELFADNPEAGETKEGLKYLVEAEVNQAKPNYMLVKRLSDKLLKHDKNDPMANYALALFYVNNRKPDLSKAFKHIETA